MININCTMKIVKRRAVVEKDKKEALKPVDDRKVGKQKAVVKADKMNTRKSKKETSAGDKDPNKPKRPPTAFFVFLEDFRKTYKQQHPAVKAVSVVGKASGEKWRSMSSAEKHPYVVKAAKRKLDYERLMNTYSKKKEVSMPMVDGANQNSDGSKSEVSDEADEDISGEGDDNEDDG